MALFLVVNVTYDAVELGFFKEDLSSTISVLIDKKTVSKDLIPTIERQLALQVCSLRDIAAIGVTTGPAPFTSLRIVIATMNALSFATGIPLIALDAMQLLLEEHRSKSLPVVALFNAYNNEVYYGFKHPNGSVISDYAPIAEVVAMLESAFGSQDITLIGNGAVVYSNEVINSNLHIKPPLTHYVSLPFLAQKTAQQFLQKDTLHDELFPAYLKQLNYKKALV